MEKPIKAGCPLEVCRVCGKPRERIVERNLVDTEGWGKAKKNHQGNLQRSQSMIREGKGRAGTSIVKTIDWSDCGCNQGFKPGIVLDPFAGSGTVGLVARKLLRDYILVDLKKEYCDMARKRLGEIPERLEKWIK